MKWIIILIILVAPIGYIALFDNGSSSSNVRKTTNEDEEQPAPQTVEDQEQEHQAWLQRIAAADAQREAANQRAAAEQQRQEANQRAAQEAAQAAAVAQAAAAAQSQQAQEENQKWNQEVLDEINLAISKVSYNDKAASGELQSADRYDDVVKQAIPVDTTVAQEMLNMSNDAVKRSKEYQEAAQKAEDDLIKSVLASNNRKQAVRRLAGDGSLNADQKAVIQMLLSKIDDTLP